MEEQFKSEDELRFHLESVVKQGMFSSLHSPFAGMPEFLERFQLSLFSVRDAGITAKRFHGWHRAELLPFAIPEGKMNLLTFPEYIWVRLIEQLRQMGTSLETIRLLKEFLFAPVNLAGLYTPETLQNPSLQQHLREALEQMQLSGQEIEDLLLKLASDQAAQKLARFQMPQLDMVLMSQVVNPNETGVVLCPGNHFQLWSEVAGEHRPTQTHLYLSITEQVQAFRMNPHLERKAKELDLPSAQEQQVLWALRDQSNKAVTVNFSGKGDKRQMDLVTTRTDVLDEETKQKIQELLHLNGYNEMMLKTEKGELVFSERSKRKRL